MNTGNIFLYTNDKNKRQHIEHITKSIGLDFKALKANQINEKVSTIVGLPAFNNSAATSALSKEGETTKKAPALWNMPELILFFGVPDAKLDEFLDKYNKSGLEKIRLKAIVTPTNLNWTLYYLVEHLKEEAKKFGR